MKNPGYHVIKEHYEKRLAEFGPNHRGVDWPDAEDLRTRFSVMLDVIRDGDRPCSLLDLGCGVGLLLDHLAGRGSGETVSYSGLDISGAMIHEAREKHPSAAFEVRDVLLDPLPEESVDYVVLNGVLTEKLSLSQDAMAQFAERLLTAAFRACRKGIAFNVMNVHVDWMREDLFHWSLDACASFIIKRLSRHMVMRMDYGLYEYAVYVYRRPA